MTETLDLVIIILATGLGIGLGWLLGTLKFSTELVRVEAEAQAAHGNKATLVAEMESVATAVARQNSEDFLRLAEERLGKVQSEANKDYDARKKEVELLVSPLKDHLEKLEKATTDMEKNREGAYQGIKRMVEGGMTKLIEGTGSVTSVADTTDDEKALLYIQGFNLMVKFIQKYHPNSKKRSQTPKQRPKMSKYR